MAIGQFLKVLASACRWQRSIDQDAAPFSLSRRERAGVRGRLPYALFGYSLIETAPTAPFRQCAQLPHLISGQIAYQSASIQILVMWPKRMFEELASTTGMRLFGDALSGRSGLTMAMAQRPIRLET